MRVTNISVELEKRANDRDYGSERAVAQLAAALDPSDDPEMSLRILVDLARASVESDLKRSANLHVRRALIRQLRLCNRCGDPLPDEEESYMHPACSDAERAERQAKYDELKAKEAERWAQSNANAEERALAGVAVGDDDDDDGDLPL